VIDCGGAVSFLNYFLVSRSKRYSTSSILDFNYTVVTGFNNITSGLSPVAGPSDSLPWRDGVQQIVLRFGTLLPCGIIHGLSVGQQFGTQIFNDLKL
jgi:hypothetical protein